MKPQRHKASIIHERMLLEAWRLPWYQFRRRAKYLKRSRAFSSLHNLETLPKI